MPQLGLVIWFSFSRNAVRRIHRLCLDITPSPDDLNRHTLPYIRNFTSGAHPTRINIEKERELLSYQLDKSFWVASELICVQLKVFMEISK